MVCPKCNNISDIFDPFYSLNVPIPIPGRNNRRTNKLYYFYKCNESPLKISEINTDTENFKYVEKSLKENSQADKDDDIIFTCPVDEKNVKCPACDINFNDQVVFAINYTKLKESLEEKGITPNYDDIYTATEKEMNPTDDIYCNTQLTFVNFTVNGSRVYSLVYPFPNNQSNVFL